MKKESKNLISAMANEAYEQWLICKTARGADLDKELKRLGGLKIASESVSSMAERQIDVLRATGFIPDDNILIDHDEVKLVNAKRSLIDNETRRKKVNLLDEFIKD